MSVGAPATVVNTGCEPFVMLAGAILRCAAVDMRSQHERRRRRARRFLLTLWAQCLMESLGIDREWALACYGVTPWRPARKG